jgi:hypothetical protein
MVEKVGHINVAMLDDISPKNGLKGPTSTFSSTPCSATVSFHNIQYKVQLKSGFFCVGKNSRVTREILVDLKYAFLKPF